MPDTDGVLCLPIRMLDKSPRRILFELADGHRFHLIGGKDRRPLATGVAGFSPREMIQVLQWGVPEEEFQLISRIKARFGGGIQGIENVTGGGTHA